jgi:hypothetical protein
VMNRAQVTQVEGSHLHTNGKAALRACRSHHWICLSECLTSGEGALCQHSGGRDHYLYKDQGNKSCETVIWTQYCS